MAIVSLGSSRLLKEQNYKQLLKGKRLGVVCHEASTCDDLSYTAERLIEAQKEIGCEVTALFSPQHGLWGGEQYNMDETAHGTWRGLPVFSLYSETRKPTAEMMKNVDVFIVDLQDVGTRIYTYVYTLSYVMEAAAEAGKEVVVLDRPNPIGGQQVQGTVLDPAYRSFVGLYPMALRHGMTLGELARWMNEKYSLNCGKRCLLHVVPLAGWKRDMHWEETGLSFISPSPNIPTPDTARTFPGLVYFEGTNVSEGRGTTHPLEQMAAPFVEPEKVLAFLRREYPSALSGCTVRRTAFKPTFNQHVGKLCHGFFLHPMNRREFRASVTSLSLMRAIRHVHANDFRWTDPPYEYETKKLPIDVISGGTFIREWVEGKSPWKALAEREDADVARFLEERRPFLMYS